MRRYICLTGLMLFICLVFYYVFSGYNKNLFFKPKLIKYDSLLENIISDEVKIQKIADGFDWVEGPVWNWKEQYLLFSDVKDNSIFKWQKNEGVTLFLPNSGYRGSQTFKGSEPGSNGLAYDQQGVLYICQHGNRRIVKLGKDNQEIVVADNYKGKRFNSPNDLVFNSSGQIYFTDPFFGLPGGLQDANKELPFSGIYRITERGVELLNKELERPNGIAFSPDEKYLYVSNSSDEPKQDIPAWYRFKVKEDGTLGPKELFYNGENFVRKYQGAPDGIKVDQQGNLYCAGPGGVYIFSSDAKLLGFIVLGEPTSNCAWGEDGFIYITSNHSVLRLEIKTRGTGWGME